MIVQIPVPDLAGLPNSAAMAPAVPAGRLRRALSFVGPPLVVLLIVLGLWYAGSYLLIDPDLRFLLPPPHEVGRVAFGDPDNLNELLAGLGLSAQVAMTGLVSATVIGATVAVVMSQARWLERSLYPYAVVLQTVPVLALVPLFGYWFGYRSAAGFLCASSSRSFPSSPTPCLGCVPWIRRCTTFSLCTALAGVSGWSSYSFPLPCPPSSPACAFPLGHRSSERWSVTSSSSRASPASGSSSISTTGNCSRRSSSPR